MRTLMTAAVLCVAASAFAAGKEASFSAPKDKVYTAALEVIAKEWRVESTNKDSGTISFRSGMSAASRDGQDLSLVIIENDTGCKVIVNAEKRGNQMITWGEGGSLSKKALRLIGERLFESKLIPASEVPKK